MNHLPIVLILLSLAVAAQAKVPPANPFTSHIVLQHGAKVPVWGSATPSEAVTVEFAGDWPVDLKPMVSTPPVGLLP